MIFSVGLVFVKQLQIFQKEQCSVSNKKLSLYLSPMYIILAQKRDNKLKRFQADFFPEQKLHWPFSTRSCVFYTHQRNIQSPAIPAQAAACVRGSSSQKLPLERQSAPRSCWGKCSSAPAKFDRSPQAPNRFWLA